jgi:DNA mismatch repair protein MutS
MDHSQQLLDAKLTPMLQQYLEIKNQHPGCLLLFRLGDFYELFFEDAIKAAPALDIVLTRRGKKDDQDIPMCGIPFHASDSYIARLIQKGFKVALCEQLESPMEAKKRGAKAVVKRDVVRVLTPGTLTEDTLLQARENNFLMALAEDGDAIGLAIVDISTGDFLLESVPEKELESAIIRTTPKEILLSQNLAKKFESRLLPWKQILSLQPQSRFDALNAHRKLLETFHVSTLEGFGQFSKGEIIAGGAILDYVTLTQKGKLPAFTAPKQYVASNYLQIDGATRQSLELHRTLKGDYKGSLLASIDRTETAAGARLLSQRLATPLTCIKDILFRQNAIRYFVDNLPLLDKVRGTLKNTPDLERILSRLVLGRAGPRDLANIKEALATVEKIKLLFPQDFASSSELDALGELSSYQALIQTLDQALSDSLPVLARDGGFIAAHFHPKLDTLRQLRDEGKKHIAKLQGDYATQTNIPTLKIKHNHVLGYYIEITSLHKDKMSEKFIHRQTLANNMRFTTVELSELERKLSTASEEALALELELFHSLVQSIMAEESSIALAARYLAIIDVASSLATLAVDENYCAPTIDDSKIFNIEQGRHPVVEKALKTQLLSFTPNSCSLQEKNIFWLLTGPNMAGKSTFLRQNALIIILAQIGAYVPAQKAHIGVVDRLFSRVGAADDLAQGRSTFMVEMVETAAILNQATKRSFVILDEIGRGTATYDGLSLAWAAAEHLHNMNECRTLFATHYHELTDLKELLPLLTCHTMQVREWNDKVIFLHEVVAGQANRSYGIHVAELAGIPSRVVGRAKEILLSLESNHKMPKHKDQPLPLFSYQETPKKNPIEEKVKEINADTVTPREALALLYELKELADA